ncbi:hypothetical protein N7499_011258 [Penicillium canescens]|nr:hypothetical protein N7499_011258 [Penicillium canescens]KAJ6182576.1 hypothetical protein N7485_001218 [Penicillium canescens]
MEPTNQTQAQVEDTTLENLQTLVETIKAENWTEFGFLVFRTDYSNEDIWVQFLEECNEILEEGIENAPAESGLSRVAECVFMKIVDDDSLANELAERVAFAYRLCAEDMEDDEPGDRLVAGLQMRMCLMVDGDCIRSVVGSGSGGEDGVPSVKAVDVTLGLDGVDGVDGGLDYSGVFRVAIRSLITKLYPALLACHRTGDLMPADGGVWKGVQAAPFYAEKEVREIDRLLK